MNEPSPSNPASAAAPTNVVGLANLSSILKGKVEIAESPFAKPNWEERLFAKLGHYSDWLSPILVKEARQAMSSQQFTLTFFLLIVFSWVWTITGSVLMLPGIYYAPWGASLLAGYILLLSVPTLLVVPFFAFRSLASEAEDGTYELMSITTLSAWQIVWGKMLTAMLQSLVYFSVLAPCVAFTYLLRGVDILMVAFVLEYAVVGSCLLCSFALMMATISTTRIWQSLLSVILVIGLLIATCFWCYLVLLFILEGPSSGMLNTVEMWTVNGYVFAFGIAISLLFLLIAAGQISFAADNRSTKIRYAIGFIQFLICAAFYTGFSFTQSDSSGSVVSDAGVAMWYLMLTVSSIYWGFMGSFLSHETCELSPRARRDLPQSVLGRILLTWFNPGSGSGYIFTIAGITSVYVFGAIFFGIPVLLDQSGTLSIEADEILAVGGCYIGYLAAYLGFGRMLSGLLQIRGREIPMLASVIIQFLLFGMGILFPILLESGLSMQFRRPFEYSLLQLPNWGWTSYQIAWDNEPGVAYIVMIVGFAIYLLNFARAARQAQEIRLPPPRRLVEEELARASQKAPRNPWTVT